MGDQIADALAGISVPAAETMSVLETVPEPPTVTAPQTKVVVEDVAEEEPTEDEALIHARGQPLLDSTISTAGVSMRAPSSHLLPDAEGTAEIEESLHPSPIRNLVGVALPAVGNILEEGSAVRAYFNFLIIVSFHIFHSVRFFRYLRHREALLRRASF